MNCEVCDRAEASVLVVLAGEPFLTCHHCAVVADVETAA